MRRPTTARRWLAPLSLLLLSALSSTVAAPVLALQGPAALPAVEEGPVINPANGHEYYLLALSSWEQAEARAIQLGGHLVTINDAAENLWVAGTFGASPAGQRALWLGLRDPAQQPTPNLTPAQRMSRFRWASGETPSYTNWWAGRPNNAGPQGDGSGSQFWTYLRGDLLWDDVDNNLDFIRGVVEVVPSSPRANRVVAWGPGLDDASTPPPSTTGAVSIGAGIGFGVALKADGSVVVWPPTGPQPPAGLGPVAQVAVGAGHVVARLRDGTVRAWGADDFGQARPPAGLVDVVSVAAGYFQSQAIDAAGRVRSWGSAPPGAPTAAELAGTWMLSAGFDEAYALKVDGALVAWGGGPGVRQKPANLPPLRWIRGGHVQAVARATDGRILGWGSNTARLTPPPFTLPVQTATASLLEPFDLAVLSDGSVVSWGESDPFPGQAAPRLRGALDVALGGNVAYALLPPPPGDSFADAVPIIAAEGAVVSIRGDNTGATREPAEPEFHGTSPGGASLWWTYTAPSPGVVTLNLSGQGHQLAAYTANPTGQSLATLSRRARRTPDSIGRFYPASLAVEAGQAIWIAVEGLLSEGAPTEGAFQLGFQFRRSAPNDLFANSRPISATDQGPILSTLLGAGREPGEPPYGARANIWWNWTAPAGLGPGGAHVTVSLTGNQDTLDLHVLEGPSLPQLKDVASDVRVVGLTTIAAFDAVAGHRYEIVAEGNPFDPSGTVENAIYSQVRLDLTASPVAIVPSTPLQVVADDATRTAVLSGAVLVRNQSPTRSGPLRLSLYRRPGFALNGNKDVPTGDITRAERVGALPFAPQGLAPGEGRTVPVDMSLPPADGQLSFGEQGTGWGGFAVLEERASTRSGTELWRALDRRLLGTGPWPFYDLSNVGPGGGAIRIDPGSGSPLLELVELAGVAVDGPDQLVAGATGTFTAKATWSDGLTEAVDPEWSVDPPARISTTGVLDGSGITTTADVAVRASYSSGGLGRVGVRKVRVSVATLRWEVPVAGVAGTTRALRLGGRPGQRLRIETASELGTWTTSTTLTVPASGQVEVPLQPVDGRPAQFLRAVVQP